MRTKKTISVLFFIFFFVFFCNAQKELYKFEQLSFDQGLPGVNIRDIFQDSRGVMWISIEAIGLCKFYGNRHVLYQEDNEDTLSISSNFVNRVLEDKYGQLWIATDNGLNRFYRENNYFKSYLSSPDTPGSLSSNVITTLFIDSHDNLWIGTDNGLNRFNYKTDNFETFLLSEDNQINPTSTSIYDIFEDEHDVFWLATSKGLIKFNPDNKSIKSFSIENEVNAPIHNLIRSIEKDSSGVLWIGTHRGLDRFDPKQEQFIHWTYAPEDQKELQNEGINNLYVDEKNQLWTGTYTKGIVIIDLKKGNYTRLNTGNNEIHGLKSNHIRYFFRDNSGVLWICSKFEGLFKQKKSKDLFNTWPPSFNVFLPLKEKHILAFYEDPILEDIYWVGTKFDGLFKADLRANTLESFEFNLKNKSGISSNRIQSISRDSNGKLFIATEYGLDYFDEKNKTFKTLSQIPINILEADNVGRIWIGAFNGLFVLENNKISRFENEDPFFSNESLDIMQIYFDGKSSLWFSTRYDGLYQYNLDKNSVTSFKQQKNEPTSISGNMIRPIEPSQDGKLWIGTKANGLNLFDPSQSSFSHFTTKDGLPVNFILGIQEDLQNNVWLSTFNGISIFDPVANTFTNFNKDYGLQGNIFELGVSGIFKDGSLIFGGHNGIDIIHPDSIKVHDAVSPLIISSVEVYSEEFKSDIVQSDTIDLSYDQNYISIEFILADYSDYNRHQFSYQLSGIDYDWVKSGNRNFVSYSDLTPGTYTFQVKGANEFGTWNENGPSLVINIRPPLYKTGIFKFAILFLLAVIVYVIYRVKSNQILKSKLALENKIQERTKKLEKALKELKDNQKKVKSQNLELSDQNEQILKQSKQIQRINKELKLAHEELQTINSELDDRVRDRTAELVKTNEELDRFVYSASHDLSAPLKSILGLVNIAKIENKNSSLDQHFELIEKSIEKLEEVINSLTQFSRNAGHEIIKKEFTLQDLVKEVLDEHRAFIQLANADIQLNFNPETKIKSDYLRLKIIFSNLISNALKHTKKDQNPHIEISFKRSGPNDVITVKDDGLGIDKDSQDKIFEMFYRANESSKGSGLGLYIVRETVNKLQGQIKLNSIPDEFTEFSVSLPAS